MKQLILALSLLPSLAFSEAPKQGDISNPVSFSIVSGGTPVNSGLSSHDGNILVLMYFTSW